MKDFIKWLGVNEKVAKVAVWMLIFMAFLIIVNAALGSLGFPNYQITYENLIKIDSTALIDAIFSSLMCFLNFYVIVLLVFRVKESKKIFKYAILYLILNYIVINVYNEAVLQLFIIAYCVLFCYFYSKKSWKYLIYGLLAIIIDVAVQGVWYYFKVKLIDYSQLGEVTQTLLSLDYFIVMGIIILVKEIYLKKRGEQKNEATTKFSMDRRIRKRRNSSQKNSK